MPSAPEAPPSYSPAGSRKSDTFSEGHKYNEQASTKSASSAGSGPTRVTHSRVSTSSGSSVSRHLDFNVPPIDLQLLPVTRSARATTASRSSVKLADSSASLGVEPASSTSVPSAGTASQVRFVPCTCSGPTHQLYVPFVSQPFHLSSIAAASYLSDRRTLTQLL